MWALINTEFMKGFQSKAYRLSMFLLGVVMLGIIVAEYQDVKVFNENQAYQEEVMSWKEREENLIYYANQSLEEDSWLTSLEKVQIERRIAIAEYRLDQEIPKTIYKNVWWFFHDQAFQKVTAMVIFLAVFVASVLIAGEYNGHTLKQLLLLPYRRWKILVAKLVAAVLLGLSLFGIMYLLGFISGVILHGFQGLNGQVVLYYGNDLTVMNMSVYSILISLLRVVDLLFYIIITLLLCILTRNVAVSSIVAGGLAVFGIPMGNFLMGYYPWVKYLPFLNLDFRKYLDFGTVMPSIEAGWNSVVVEGITPLLSIVIIGITAVICVAGSMIAFQRQDV